MNVRINGRPGHAIDSRDRGLQYGDGLFETMRIHGGRACLLEYHLDRLWHGCRTLALPAPDPMVLRREIEKAASGRRDGILKLVLTRGRGSRGYRPTGAERGTRILSLHALPRAGLAGSASAARVRLCTTPISMNPRLAGLKTLNRLDSVLARAEWRNERIWEGLMSDVDGNWVCGTMSNLFLKRGDALITPLLDRCGVAGVMRRWILENAGVLNLRVKVRRVRWQDLRSAEEVFMSNAVIGIRSVRAIEGARHPSLRFSATGTAESLRVLLGREWAAR
ncbi:MAG TPA: aminodeoxychorismate lyase [Steroidobacteraceae bacterium]|nr:aminodeoxychorismate lyase [Steroidobacteraceae bacterium]